MHNTLTVRALHPVFAAEIRGLDLREPLTPDIATAIEQAVDRYAVVVFRDQQIDGDQQMAFAENFGTIEPTRANVGVEKDRLKPGLNDISNLGADGSILAKDARRRIFNLGNRLWHSDSSFKKVPAKYSMLYGKIIPPVGGQTEFADMRAAWDALPEETQQQISDLVCEHSLLFSRAVLGFADFTEAERATYAPVRQRLVRRHAGSGRRSIFLSSHIGGIDGWQVPEALALLRDLTEHATQREFVYTHQWRVNDLVLWDNRCTMHRGRAYDDQRHPRDMQRVTLEDSASTLDQPA
ncbi:MAG: alpha-ketoglutarate-dependent 2,4-dichlorophenoxyacetate dioxygenase [Burkholderiales bacterium]